MIDIAPTEQLTRPDSQPFRTIFTREIQPPKNTSFVHSVQLFQPEADSETRIIAFGGKSRDGKDDLKPFGLEIVQDDYLSDRLLTYAADVSSRVLAAVPIPIEDLTYQLFYELGESPDPGDERPFEQRLIERLKTSTNPAILARFPLANVDFQGLQFYSNKS